MGTQTILVTGGAGYIGSHAVVELLEAGHDAVVVDNLSNSSAASLDRVAEITGRRPTLHEVDLREAQALLGVFERYRFDAVMHFAGLKAVGESVEEPMRYYSNNLLGTINLIEAMEAAGVRRMVFSSSATVYGDPSILPVAEDAPLGALNPYGRSKLFIEDMLLDVALASAGWRIALLRYFNPVGAHPSGRIGEDPAGIPNNLMPYIMQVATGRQDKLRVFGDDYPTPDGTCIRDYIHVVDVAIGHLAALDRLDTFEGAEAVNLGTGQGHSVLEVVTAATEAVGLSIPYEVVGRRPGDAARCYADVTKAEHVLGWKAERDLATMCTDHWRWQHANPRGYSDT